MNSNQRSSRLCKAFADLLLERRKSLGLSHQKVAERAGITRPMVSFVERSKRIPTLDTVSRLATALGSTSAQLVAEAERRSQRK
jgi:transcriptional regulator with XRE-family HTH domain